jgi:uncharacterized protein with PQ loop repeat
MRTLILFFAFYMVSFLVYGISEISLDTTARNTVIGITTNIFLILFYISPLSTLPAVIKSKDASSIHPVLTLVSLVNGALWCVYGFALRDVFIWMPNGVGVLCCVVLVSLRVMFPKGKTSNSGLDAEKGSENGEGEVEGRVRVKEIKL